MMINFRIENAAKALRNPRVVLAALIVNFVVSPPLAGFLSAGGKPFTVPLYNVALGHHPRRAYALASLGVVSGAWAGLFTLWQASLRRYQFDKQLALYLFVIIVLTALIVERVWTARLNRIVTYVIAPILVFIGVRFLWMALIV